MPDQTYEQKRQYEAEVTYNAIVDHVTNRINRSNITSHAELLEIIELSVNTLTSNPMGTLLKSDLLPDKIYSEVLPVYNKVNSEQ